jgi:hypothetical protein
LAEDKEEDVRNPVQELRRGVNSELDDAEIWAAAVLPGRGGLTFFPRVELDSVAEEDEEEDDDDEEEDVLCETIAAAAK